MEAETVAHLKAQLHAMGSAQLEAQRAEANGAAKPGDQDGAEV